MWVKTRSGRTEKEHPIAKKAFKYYVEVGLLGDELGHALGVTRHVMLELCREYKSILRNRVYECWRSHRVVQTTQYVLFIMAALDPVVNCDRQAEKQALQYTTGFVL